MTAKVKRVLSAILTLVMVLSLTNVVAAEKFVHAAETEAAGAEAENRFHYSQLTEDGKAVYNGIYQMYTQGLLKTGTASYDIAEDMTTEQLQVFEKNTASLRAAVDAARYAFYADYPEVFYVNFAKLTYRTTRDGEGKFHINIGSGRNPSYLIDGFSSPEEVEAAINEFDARVDEIVSGAQTLEIKAGRNAQAEQVRYVHNEIVQNASYRLEDSAFNGEIAPGKFINNAPLLGTPYGVLVRKQGVCEGYARAFKVVMDQLGINCILVQGAHQNDAVAVNHMWNYVELTNTVATTRAKARSVESKWYAVDATLDDPEFPVTKLSEILAENEIYKNNTDMAGGEYGKTGYEYEKYVLAGQLTMNQAHYAVEEVEAAGGYRFAYPPIEDNDFAVKSVTNDLDGFVVKTKDEYSAEMNGMVTEFQFNYLGMTASKAREKGIYLLFRYYEENAEGELVPVVSKVPGLETKSWFYLSEAYGFKEGEGFTCIREGEKPYVEIAATRTPPTDPNVDLAKSFVYLGDENELIARTGKLYNPNQNDYVAAPYIKTQTPTQTSTILVSNRFYHIKAEYDEKLKLDKDYTIDSIGTKIVCKSGLGNPVTGAEYSQIKNIHWDGDRTIEFDMKFSLMFADDNVAYSIYPVGLIGETSEKVPNPITYSVAQGTECPSIMQRDGNWEIFGKPTLMESDDLSMKGWQTSTGDQVSDLLRDRLTLVASKPSETQTETMESMVTEPVLDSATYNISLSVCKACVIKTGHKVKVKLGFPAGYGPNDEGVTFKAYHFMRDDQGNITGVEEIDCVVTQYGLILTCDAFSPFMVAAVEKDETVAEQKTVVVTASDGGTVTGDGLDATGVLTLGENASQTVTVAANEGYQIESVTVCGKPIDVTDKKSMNVTVSYSDVENANNIVHANFVAEVVAAQEEAKGEVPTEPVAEAVAVTIPASKTGNRDGLKIESTVGETPGTLTYQWYKDGEKLEGKIGKDLIIERDVLINAEDPSVYAGEYTVKVTNTVGTLSAESVSEACAVTVNTTCDHMDKMSSYTPSDADKNFMVSAATCSAPAVYYEKCSDCGAKGENTFEYGEVDSNAHEFGTYEPGEGDANFLASGATCNAKATYYEKCSLCNAKGENTFEYGEFNPENHGGGTMVNGRKEPTETEPGYTGDTYCSGCAEKIGVGEEIPAIGCIHEFGEYTPGEGDEAFLVSAATCNAKAVYYKKCTKCGEKGTGTFEYGEVDPSNHVGETITKNEKEPTETEPGYTGDKCCGSCDAVLESGKEIPATGETNPEPESTDPKITVTGGTIIKVNGIAVPEGSAKENYPYNTVLTVKANADSGTFAYWNNNGARISYSEEYQFYVKGDMNIEAKFNEDVTPEPVVAFMMQDRTADPTGKQTVKLGISVDVPDGYDYEVISEGILRSYNDPGEGGLVVGKPGVTNHVSKTRFEKGNYTYSFTIAKNSTNKIKTIYTCGYVTYKEGDAVKTVYTPTVSVDANGNVETVYTPAVSVDVSN